MKNRLKEAALILFASTVTGCGSNDQPETSAARAMTTGSVSPKLDSAKIKQLDIVAARFKQGKTAHLEYLAAPYLLTGQQLVGAIALAKRGDALIALELANINDQEVQNTMPTHYKIVGTKKDSLVIQTTVSRKQLESPMWKVDTSRSSGR